MARAPLRLHPSLRPSHLSGAVGRYATVQPNLWEGCILNSFLKGGRSQRGVRARAPLPPSQRSLLQPLPSGAGEGVGARPTSTTSPHRKPTVEGNLRGAPVWGGRVARRRRRAGEARAHPPLTDSTPSKICSYGRVVSAMKGRARGHLTQTIKEQIQLEGESVRK